MEITYYGHSCFQIQTEGKSIVFDPFIQANTLAESINIADISCDYMLISHAHEDHIADVESFSKLKEFTLVSNYEIVSWFAKIGIEKGHPMNHGGSWNFDFGKVKYVNAVHSSSFPDGSYGGNPGGFLLEIEGKTIYYAGDTALHVDMKLIGSGNAPDLAFLPIGDNFTMGYEDALIAADFIKCESIIGMHYDTFPYIEIDKKAAVNAFANEGKELTLMEIGKAISF